jgi:hypothetical protein
MTDYRGPRCGGGPEIQGTVPRFDAAGARTSTEDGGGEPQRRVRPLSYKRCDPAVAMLIRLDDNTLVDDLCAHYRRSGFGVEHMGGGMIEVTRNDAPSPDQERREVLMHLRVWEAVNPNARANCSAEASSRPGTS